MPPTYNSLIYERLFTNCELWKRSHKQLPSETDRVIPDEDGWYRISDDTDLKRDIRWYWYETWYQVTLICNVISIWYRLSEPVIHTELEWVVNTNVKTKQAGNSYGGHKTRTIMVGKLTWNNEWNLTRTRYGGGSTTYVPKHLNKAYHHHQGGLVQQGVLLNEGWVKRSFRLGIR